MQAACFVFQNNCDTVSRELFDPGTMNVPEQEIRNIMNLHEYQGKQLFAEYGLPVSKGYAVDSVEEALAALIRSVVTCGWLKPGARRWPR